MTNLRRKRQYIIAVLAKSQNKKVALSLSDLFCVDRHRIDFLNLIENYVDIIFANEHEIKSLYKSI